MATIRQLTSGGYSVKVNGTELSLITTELEQTGRVSRFGIEVLNAADQAIDGARLAREIGVHSGVGVPISAGGGWLAW
jgi:hypothetical protein